MTRNNPLVFVEVSVGDTVETLRAKILKQQKKKSSLLSLFLTKFRKNKLFGLRQ